MAGRRLVFTVVLLVLGLVAPAAAAGSAGAVDLGAARLSVPSKWPVEKLSPTSTACVRLDRRAVYLGHQPAGAACPSHAVGATRAVQVEPLDAIATQGLRFEHSGRLRRALGTRVNGRLVVAVPSLGVVVTLPRRTAPAVTRRVLRSIRRSGAPAAPRAKPRSAAQAPPGRSERVVVYTGEGFDTCTAPSEQTMSAWLSSPYRAVGVYIGGVNRACSQANLSSGWVHNVEAQGWHLIPTYVGLQAPCTNYSAKIDPATADQQGREAADDAIAQGTGLGLGGGDPIYFDMEQWNSSDQGCSGAVKAFLQGWTNQLHAKGWTSGVYGSASSVGAVLSQANGTGYTEPDDLWYANWDNRHTTSGDPYVSDGGWSNHQRIHQYHGGSDETYGGVTLNVDGDYVDAATAGAAPSYAYSVGSVATFADPGLSIPLDLGSTKVGQDAWVRVVATNTGSATWQQGGANPVHLGTWAPQDRASAFATSDWITGNRAAGLAEASVAPGASGTFVAHLRVPLGATVADEHFNLAAEGLTWMPDQGLNVHVRVLPYAWTLAGHKAFSGPRLRHRISLRRLHPRQSAWVVIAAFNAGTQTWRRRGANPVRLGTWGPQDRRSRFRARDWISRSRAVGIKRAKAPGKVALLKLHLRAPRRTGRYVERFNLVAEGATWMPDQGLALRLRVRPRRHARHR